MCYRGGGICIVRKAVGYGARSLLNVGVMDKIPLRMSHARSLGYLLPCLLDLVDAQAEPYLGSRISDLEAE